MTHARLSNFTCQRLALPHCSIESSCFSYHREEFEAEQYAHDALRRYYVPVPRKETEGAKKYVAIRIDQAIRMRKAKQLDREAVRWSETKHRRATREALADKTVKLVYLGSRKFQEGRLGVLTTTVDSNKLS